MHLSVAPSLAVDRHDGSLNRRPLAACGLDRPQVISGVNQLLNGTPHVITRPAPRVIP
jgi:hypothetical protein